MKQMKNNQAKRKFNIFPWIRKSLQLQILIPFITLIVLTGGIISYVSYHSSVNITTDELTDSVEGQMRSMNDTFEIYFSNIESTLNRLTSNDSFKDPLNSEKNIVQMFKETNETMPTITH